MGAIRCFSSHCFLLLLLRLVLKKTSNLKKKPRAGEVRTSFGLYNKTKKKQGKSVDKKMWEGETGPGELAESSDEDPRATVTGGLNSNILHLVQ